MAGRAICLPRRLLAAFAASLLLGGQLQAAATAPSEFAVKAAFLPKFAGYVGWPGAARPAAGAPLVLCLVGGDPFGRVIDQAVRGQQIDQHPIALRRLASADAAAGCHIAFVQGNAARGTSELLGALDGRPVLTVTDERAGPQRGMVHFVVSQGRVRFHIDEAAAARSGLAINSRLLAIALSVRQRR
jgi:uncharacterized protein DUF4154